MSPKISIVETDVLVLGGGLAGHRAALAAAAQGARVALTFRSRGASPFVSGFNVPLDHAGSGDSPEAFFDDMVKGGYGLNDRRLVRALTQNAVAAFDELVAAGVEFETATGKLPDGGPLISQRHLSGNSVPRTVYVREGTGRQILKSLTAGLSGQGIEVFAGLRIIGLLALDGRVIGALGWNSKSAQLTAFGAQAIVLAMGGIGRLYPDSTYPVDVCADGLGLALEAGARLIDMEFVQFEPVVTVWPEDCRGMEMPTAMLGDGVHLRNAHGKRFMEEYNPPNAERGIEKASMALFIQKEIDEGRGLPEGGVIFDTTVLPRESLESYASHCRRLRAAGVDPAVTAPIVAPAAHSLMGGVFIDENGWSGVPGLFVCGEAAGGLHGASRIAGNGSTDTIVFGGLTGRAAAQSAAAAPRPNATFLRDSAQKRLAQAAGSPNSEWSDGRKAQIRRLIGAAAGLWRSEEGLSAALEELTADQPEEVVPRGGTMMESVAAAEAARMRLVAETILRAALIRTESRGAHQRLDFPQTDDLNWLHHTAFSLATDGALIAQPLAIH